jgi:hypothetical protein
MEQKTEIPRQPRDREKLFRVTAEEDEKLDILIKLACEMEDVSSRPYRSSCSSLSTAPGRG